MADPVFNTKGFAIHSASGRCYYIDPETNKRYDAMHVYEIDAKIQTKKVQAYMLGRRMPDEIVTGVTSKGTLSYYWCSDIFNQKILNFINGFASAPTFELHVFNEDVETTSKIGNRHVVLENCSLNEYTVASLNAEEQDLIKITSDFTFSGVRIVEAFKNYPGLINENTVSKKL